MPSDQDQPVVTARQRVARRADLLVGEPVRILLVGVHHGLQLGDAGGLRAVGTRTLVRACLPVRGDCQNTASRPRAVVNTNCERFSRLRFRSKSTVAPRRTQERTGTRSTMSGSAG